MLHQLLALCFFTSQFWWSFTSIFRAINAPFLSNLTFLSCTLFSFLLFVVNILRTAFFSFPLFVSFISYAFSSLFEYCDRIKHIACFLLCLISKLLSTSVCSSLYLFLALESSVFSFFSSEYWLIVNLIPHELFKQFHLTIALVSRSIGFS